MVGASSADLSVNITSPEGPLKASLHPPGSAAEPATFNSEQGGGRGEGWGMMTTGNWFLMASLGVRIRSSVWQREGGEAEAPSGGLLIHSFVAHLLRLCCVQAPGWAPGPQPGIIRSHTSAPKELLEEWSQTDTQEVTRQRGQTRADLGPERSGMFKPERSMKRLCYPLNRASGSP